MTFPNFTRIAYKLDFELKSSHKLKLTTADVIDKLYITLYAGECCR